MTPKAPKNKTRTRKIEVYDTTLRDGAQAEGISFSLEDKLLIAAKLDELGIDYLEGGYPLSNAKDEAFFKEIRKQPLKHTKIVAFGMTRKKGVKARDDLGLLALLNPSPPLVVLTSPLAVFPHIPTNLK